MKAPAGHAATGAPGEVLAVVDVEVPEPGPGEVLVAVAAASLNFNDIDRCRGKLVSVPTPPPYTLGMDVCGVVEAAGSGAEAWLGRRVVAITKTALGGIAEYAIAPAVSVFDAPARARRRRGHRLPAPVPHVAPGPVPSRPAARRARRWSCTPPPAGWAPPASSWAGPPAPA